MDDKRALADPGCANCGGWGTYANDIDEIRTCACVLRARQAGRAEQEQTTELELKRIGAEAHAEIDSALEEG